MNINWHNIRTINGDQKEGFEELITQLARKEVIQNQCHFIRKGKPDAGVECFWTLNDNTEWAWQAKYFTSSLDASQWNQIEESIKTLIDKHKNVVKYFIAIPIDPPDGKTTGTKSLLEKWDEHITKWNGWTNNKIEFIPWWNSDIIERLQKPENSGFIKFWFNKELFTDDWFKQKLDASIADLGNRYTPLINFELDIVKIFDGAARDSKFSKQLYEKLDKLIISLRKVTSSFEDTKLSKQVEILFQSCCFLKQEYINILSIVDEQYDFSKLDSEIKSIYTTINNIENRIDELLTTVKKEEIERLDHSKYYIRNTYSPINDFQEFINSTTAKLFNTPCLLIDGEAGIGKSHLLADIAHTRIKENKYSILLLGQKFNNSQNPQKQILNELDLACTFEEFLESLNCKAQISGTRIIIFIDAINEGAGKIFWPDCLNGFIRSFSKYSWLALVCSVRSSYLKLFDDNIKYLSSELIRYTHYGFRNNEYAASKLFFTNYGIELPSIPLLHPEFQNPLFLKIFCESLKKAGYTKIPDGLNGITTIFNFFIDSINIKLASPSYFNYSSGINIVKKVIQQLVKYKQSLDLYYIPVDISVQIISDIQKTYNITGNLTDALISEGILSKNIFWKQNRIHEEGLYISYERFEDHLIASELLGNISAKSLKQEFEVDGQLYTFIKDEYSINRNKGIIEALSIQLPEIFGIELFELIKNVNSHEIAEAFVSSLLWRKNELEVSNKTMEYIHETILTHHSTYEYFWDTIIAVSINPKQFFNANKIHEILSKYSLSDRDAEWTQLIHNWYDDEKAVKRLIDWAWSIDDKNHISDESVELAATMISWFLTSTNRRLRDSSTKANICLLTNRIPVVINLLKKFENVNDPYVYERIFAIAYGCTLRTKKNEDLKELSEYIYETIFKKDKIYPHVLLRDYARNIIEYTLSSGIALDIEIEKIRPPYKSDIPPIPSDSEITNFNIEYTSPDFKDHFRSIRSILSSMEVEYTRDGKGAGYGDFGRYVFQSHFRYWEQLNPVDLKNIAIKRIFELGYDVEKHGKFDRKIGYQGRHYVATERIGKKYQWIAMHELLAQVSDNYKMKAPWSWGNDIELMDFCGPWEPYTRDIDPSVINKISTKDVINIQPNIEYNNWTIDNKLWLKDVSDLPEPRLLIEDTTNEWIMLEGSYTLSENRLLGNELYSIPQKEFWFQIKSYLVPTKQYAKISKWLLGKNFMDLWMPEATDRYEIFNREYYWSPANNYFQKEYYSGNQLREIFDRENDKKIGDVIVTTESYLWEASNDLSKEEALRLLKPCSKLVEDLQLSYQNNESYMYLKSGEIVCFDNSEGKENVTSCLYFNKSILQEFLAKHDYKIIWTVLGEKNVMGEYDHESYGSWPVVSGVYFFRKGKITGKINKVE